MPTQSARRPWRHPLYVAPIAAFGHYRQLKPFRFQMQVQLANTGETFEVLQHFFDRALHAEIRMLLAERCLTADIAWRQAVVLFAALRFLPQAVLHAVEDHGQFEFVEGPLDAQHHAVLGVDGIVQAMPVGQQHIAKTTEPHQVRPVLIVANQTRQFACRDESGLAGEDGFQECLELRASVLRTARLTGVSVEQDDPRAWPAERGDVLDHGLLSPLSFLIVADLAGTALTQIDVSGLLQMMRLNIRMGHWSGAPNGVGRQFRDRLPSARRVRADGRFRVAPAKRTTDQTVAADRKADGSWASPDKGERSLLRSCQDAARFTSPRSDVLPASERVRAALTDRRRAASRKSSGHRDRRRPSTREQPAGLRDREDPSTPRPGSRFSAQPRSHAGERADETGNKPKLCPGNGHHCVLAPP